MKNNRHRSISTLVALAMLSTVALAQDEPKTEATPVPEPEQKLNTLKLGYSAFWTRGNRNRARQFGSMAAGFTVEELSYVIPGTDTTSHSLLSIRDYPDRDYYVGASTILAGGATQLSFDTNHRRYYQPGFTPNASSSDRDTHLTASQSFGKSGIFAAFEDSLRSVNPERPEPGLHPRTQRLTAGFQGQFGNFNTAVTVGQTKFTEGFGLQPNGVQKVIAAQLSSDLGPSGNIAGTASFTTIRQVGLKDSTVRNLGLAASFELGSSSILHLDVSRQDITLPNVLSAYDRQRFNTGAKIVSRLGGWGFQAGIRHREAERVRADRTFVDVPAWNTFDVRLSRQVDSGMRFSLRGSWDNLTAGAPANTVDTRRLLWDDKAMAQAKLDIISGEVAAYACYTYRFRQNVARSTKLDWHNITLGLSKPFGEKASGYGELSYDSFRGGGAPDLNNVRLGSYFPSSLNFGVGMTLTPTAKTTVSAGVNAFATNNLWGTQLSASYRRQLTNDHSLEVIAAPWSTHDRLYGQTGYSTSIFSVKYSIKF